MPFVPAPPFAPERAGWPASPGLAADTRAAAFAGFAALARTGTSFFAGARAPRCVDRVLVDRVEADQRDGVGAVDRRRPHRCRRYRRCRRPLPSLLRRRRRWWGFPSRGRFVFADRESEAESTAAAFAPFSAFTALSGFAALGGVAFEARSFDAQRAAGVVDRATETVRAAAGGRARLDRCLPRCPPPPSLPKPPSPPLPPEPPAPPLPP